MTPVCPDGFEVDASGVRFKRINLAVKPIHEHADPRESVKNEVSEKPPVHAPPDRDLARFVAGQIDRKQVSPVPAEDESRRRDAARDTGRGHYCVRWVSLYLHHILFVANYTGTTGQE